MDIFFHVNFISSERVHSVFESSRFYLSVRDAAFVQLHRELAQIQIWHFRVHQAHVGVVPGMVIPFIFVSGVSDVLSIVMKMVFKELRLIYIVKGVVDRCLASIVPIFLLV